MKYYNIFLMLILAALTMVSCSTSDDLAGPGEEVEEEETVEHADSCSCFPLDFVHHDAVTATDVEMGNIEYWECTSCLKTYTDGAGMNQVTDGLYIMPASYLMGDTLLKVKNCVIDFEALQKPDQKLTGGIMAVISVAGLIVGFVNTGLGMQGTITKALCDDWGTAFKTLNAINETLNSVDRKVDEIKQKLSNLPYLIKISNRKSDLCAMKSNIYYYSKVIGEDMGAEKWDQLKLHLTEFSNLTYGGVPYPDMIKALMQNYYTGEIGEKKFDYPEMWENYTNGMCPWEHDGYTFRGAIQLNDIAYLTMGWGMAYRYYKDVKQYTDEQHRQIDLNEMKLIQSNYNDTCMASLKRMASRQLTLRRFNPAKVCFGVNSCRDVTAQAYRDWFDKNWKERRFPRDNENNWAVMSCDGLLMDMMRYPTEKTYMTPQQARQIYETMNTGKSPKQSIYYLLSDKTEVGLYSDIQRYKDRVDGRECILCGPFKSDFSHYDNDSAKPHYNMYAWESWKSYNHDSFSIKGWRDNATTGIDNIIKNCDISTYGSDKGQITKRGDTNNFVYRSIEVVKDE